MHNYETYRAYCYEASAEPNGKNYIFWSKNPRELNQHFIFHTFSNYKYAILDTCSWIPITQMARNAPACTTLLQIFSDTAVKINDVALTTYCCFVIATLSLYEYITTYILQILHNFVQFIVSAIPVASKLCLPVTCFTGYTKQTPTCGKAHLSVPFTAHKLSIKEIQRLLCS